MYHLPGLPWSRVRRLNLHRVLIQLVQKLDRSFKLPEFAWIRARGTEMLLVALSWNVKYLARSCLTR